MSKFKDKLEYLIKENDGARFVIHPTSNEERDDVFEVMKKIGIRYAYYYNQKYQRTGHLFQDRYKSEPIETESYLLTVFRYILKESGKSWHLFC